MPLISTSVDKKNTLTVESSDLLQDVNKGDVKKLLKIARFQIRTEIPLGEGGNAAKAELGAKLEATKIKKDLEHEVEELAKKLEKLLKEDATGNKKAGAEAEKLTKETEKTLKAALPDFGPQIRKAAEKGWGKKLSTSQRSLSSGGFSGLELLAEFSAGDSEFVPHLKELAEGVEKLGKELAKKTFDESRSLTKYQELLSDYFKAFKKEQAGNKSLSAQHYRDANGRRDADKVLAAGKEYESHVDDAARNLEKATKEFEKVEKFEKTAKDPSSDTKSALRTSEDFAKSLKALVKAIGERAQAMDNWRPGDVLSNEDKWDNVERQILKLDPAETRKLGAELEKDGKKFEELTKRLRLG